jgi:vancomycin resistance protein YoaR
MHAIVPAARVSSPAVTRGLRLLAIGLAAVATLALGATFVERALWRGRVLPGVRLAGASVAGRDAAGVRDAIAAGDARLLAPRAFAAHEVRLTADPASLALTVDRHATATAVVHAGRRGNPVAQVLGTFTRLVHDDFVEWTVTVDGARVTRLVDGWAAQVRRAPTDGSLRFRQGEVVPVDPAPGRRLDRAGARETVVAALATANPGPFALPVQTIAPDVDRDDVARVARDATAALAAPFQVTLPDVTLTAAPEQLAAALRAEPVDHHLELRVDKDTLHAALGPDLAAREKPLKDATFAVDHDKVRVVPSEVGRGLDLDPVVAALLRGEHIVAGQLVDLTPTHDTAWAERLHIAEKVSTFTTRHPAGQPRVANIHRAADIMQNHVIEPGERFSLNAGIGPRTEARGFVKAPVIYEGEFQEDVGGGVSQFATTFYNAVFFGGYKIVFHQPHSFFISRYPMGREATISAPSPDLVFVNDTDAGILVRTSYNAVSVTVTFYGTTAGRTVTAEGPNVFGTHEPTVEFVDDPTLPVGVENERQKPFTGYDVEVFRVISQAGKPPVRERIVTHYKALNRKVARGTGPPASTTTSTAPPAPGATTTTTRTPASSTTTTKKP